jgi:hypothetical protein
MITLREFLNIMSTDCELEVLDEESLGVLNLAGFNYDIKLPDYLRDTPVVHFTPGIITKIFIKEPKF